VVEGRQGKAFVCYAAGRMAGTEMSPVTEQEAASRARKVVEKAQNPGRGDGRG